MPNYAEAVIYKITHDDYPDDSYVGSTTQTLAKRISSHRCRAAVRPQPVHKFLNDAGWDKVKITTIEKCSCEHKQEVLSRERFWISQIGTLNKNVPGRTPREYNQMYYENHKDDLIEKFRAYYKAHRGHKMRSAS
jgi:hypothetical protein